MKNTSLKTKVQLKTKGQSRVGENANVKVELSKGTMIAIGTVPALVGIWAAACFIGGTVASGGPISFVKSWFMAIVGM